jgi:hypothetical protein
MQTQKTLLTELFPAQALPALKELLFGHECSERLGADRWNFAIELESLSRLGLTNTVLRLLERQGHAEHANETTRARSRSRSFRPAGLRIALDTACVVLTAAGATFTREWIASCANPGAVPEQSAPSRGVAGRPRWDNTAGELWFAGDVVKRLMRPAPNQRLILQAFQEDHWPRAIDDPLRVDPNLDPAKRLRDTIDNLNRHVLRRLIRFSGTGNGTGIRWEARNGSTGIRQ